MTQYRFYKEDNKWYIHLPNWEGEQWELEMVAGADTMLEELSLDEDEVYLEISETPFDNASLLEFLEYDGTDTGANYFLKKVGDKEINQEVWLCNVTKFIFGHFPKSIYFNITEPVIGTTGEVIDLFNAELTQEEWNALCIVHRLKNRLNLGIRFDWSKSIDVRTETTSQIVDETVFLDKEK